MSPSPTSSIITNVSIAAATAVSRSWDCACGPLCALFVDQNCARQSGAGGRLVLPGFWMVVATVLVCWFVLIVEKVHDASPKTPQKVDAKASFSTVKTALSAVIGEPSSTIIHHSLAGRLLPEKVEVKRSEPESKKAIDNTTTNIPDKHPGATRIAILLALLLLSAMLVPMAFAEPTSTNMPPTSLTLPAWTPCTTAFNATGMALSVDLQEKDKPQTWYWIPPNSSSERRSVSSMLSLIPLLLMGFFMLLPEFVAGKLEKDIEIIDDVDIKGRSAPSDTSPVWIINFFTTTVWPPASTVTAPREASPEPTEKPISVVSNGGSCGPSAEVEICTEANPAVCPIVLGRKPWKVV
jgi:hypothetical protein